MENKQGPMSPGSLGYRLERWSKLIDATRKSLTTSKVFGKLGYQASAHITAAEATLDSLSSEISEFCLHINCHA